MIKIGQAVSDITADDLTFERRAINLNQGEYASDDATEALLSEGDDRQDIRQRLNNRALHQQKDLKISDLIDAFEPANRVYQPRQYPRIVQSQVPKPVIGRRVFREDLPKARYVRRDPSPLRVVQSPTRSRAGVRYQVIHNDASGKSYKPSQQRKGLDLKKTPKINKNTKNGENRILGKTGRSGANSGNGGGFAVSRREMEKNNDRKLPYLSQEKIGGGRNGVSQPRRINRPVRGMPASTMPQSPKNNKEPNKT